MGQMLVRKFDDDLKTRLKARAKRHGVSMEEEARVILRDTLFAEPPSNKEEVGFGTYMMNLFGNIPDNEEPFENIRNEPVRAATFDE